MAEFAGVLFGSLAGVWTAIALAERRRPGASLSPFPALVLGTILIGAWGYAALDPLHGGLVAASALCGTIAPRGSWRATVLRTAAALLLAGLAVALAYGAAADRWQGLL